MGGFLLVHLLTGLAGASSLFLVASGLTVIFGVTRVVNFAHGSLTMLGAYIGWTLLSRLPHTPAGFVLGVLAAAGVLAVLGAMLEMTLLRRLYRSPDLFQLLATFGVLLMVQDGVLALWGPDDLTLARPAWLRASMHLSDERFPLYDLVLIAIGPIMLVTLWLLFTRTRWGRLIRAATQDREMVAALGVDQRVLFTSVFALGAGLAGLGGALTLPDASANLGIDLSVIIDAFVVVVVGGLGSVGGAYLASLLIGLLQAFGIALFPKATLVLVFVVMAVVLMVRPNGLLGRPIIPSSQGGSVRLVRPPTPWMLRGWLLLLLAAAAAPLVVGPYLLSILTEAMVAVLFAASLHFMMGPGGMLSFGHAAWFGIGAYAAGLSAQRLSLPTALGMPLGMLLAPLTAAAVAALFAAFVVRLSGVYLAMLTLAFAQIVWAVAFQWAAITGGDNGILGIWPPAWASGAATYYLLAVALCSGGTFVLRRVLYAPFGYALRAARDAPARAEAIGLDTRRIRLVAFVLAAAAAGLSGAVFAYLKGSVFPGVVSIPRSVDALLMVLLGGVQTMGGPIVGALAYTGLYDGLLRLTELWRLALGAAIVVLVLAFPDGISGAVRRGCRAS